MAGKIDVKKAALTLGLVFAVWHLGWVLGMLIFGEGFLGWIMDLHFISMAIPVAAFDIATLLMGVVGAFICGALTGAIFAYIWNKL